MPEQAEEDEGGRSPAHGPRLRMIQSTQTDECQHNMGARGLGKLSLRRLMTYAVDSGRSSIGSQGHHGQEIGSELHLGRLQVSYDFCVNPVLQRLCLEEYQTRSRNEELKEKKTW